MTPEIAETLGRLDALINKRKDTPNIFSLARNDIEEDIDILLLDDGETVIQALRAELLRLGRVEWGHRYITRLMQHGFTFAEAEAVYESIKDDAEYQSEDPIDSADEEFHEHCREKEVR